MPQDFLYRGLFTQSNIRFSYALTSELANTAILQHQTDPVASHILCRGLTAAALTSPQLTEEEKFSFQWDYTGPLSRITIEAAADAKVRGYTNQKNLIGLAETEEELYGEKGTLSVIKSTSKRVLNSGTAEATLFDIVDDLSYYFSVSNQNETDVVTKLHFRPNPESPVEISQGVLLQAMPDCDYEVLEKMRANMRSVKFQELLASQPETDNYFELLIREMTDGLDEQAYEIYACNKPQFYCSCDKNKTLNVIRTLDNTEIQEIIDKGETVKVNCDFCSTTYDFDSNDLKILLD